MILCLILSIPVLWLVGIFLGDCDFSLRFWERFGSSPKAKLYGRVCWITGASSGIGENLAYELAKFGCKLVLSARRRSELERVKEQCIANTSYNADQDILVLPMDVTEYDKHTELVRSVLDHFNKIDILINNSGRSQRGLAVETPGIEVEKAMLDLNFLAVVSLTKAVLPHMIERKNGHIVVTSSVAGKIGAPMSTSYNATKFAVQGYFDGLRVELFPKNIHVTLVCPGPVRTAIRDNAFTEQDKGVVAPPATKDNRMETSRCAQLIVTGVTNKLDELWISPNPILFFLYAQQYLPNIFAW
ncbi:predicted protein [Nematostella vectensis]|uniref:Dehydrogenase/reductase SDR family member 7 n=1 Tax=Nematostella vectensis TaxID=45351 RepID=A7RZW0_NEMVE|nr:predicted protein [Nematostella vectensis]|eukprot:XP_001635077.1 predicted protein [Nematostella vectensis]